MYSLLITFLKSWPNNLTATIGNTLSTRSFPIVKKMVGRAIRKRTKKRVKPKTKQILVNSQLKKK